MSKHRPSQRILAMAMSIVMVLGMTPVTAMAQTTTDTSGEIIAFEALSEETANREVSLGISLEDLNLPGTLNATVRVAVETDEEEPLRDSGEPEQAADEPEPAVATPSDVRENQPAEDEERIAGDHTDPDEPVQATTGSAVTLGESGTQGEPKQPADPEFMEMNIPVPVEWVSSPDYDGDKAGTYIFTAQIEGFTVRAELPQITVTVGTPAGVVTAFAPLADEIRWQSVEFGTVQKDLNLPETLSATVEGETAEVPVTWEAEPAYDANTKGLYLFTAQLEEGWSAMAELPHIAVVVRAEEPRFTLFGFGGGAQETDPFLIGTAAQLAEIAALTNAGQLETIFLGSDEGTVYLKLDNDIDLSSYMKDGGWVPIGSFSKSFKGSFDGGNHAITGLTINRSQDFQGLFGFIEGGSVQNLGVVNANITVTGNFVGGMAGYVDSSTVQNCYVTGNVTGTNNVGGVAGQVDSSSGTIKNCYSTGSISGTSNVGGVAGRVYGSTVQNCYSTGTVTGTGQYTGGVAGDVITGGRLQGCYSTGSISGAGFVGGVAGCLDGGTAQNCYSTGSVSGAGYVGGVAGRSVTSALQNCAALNPSVTGGSNVGRAAGGIIGGTLSGNIAFGGMTVNGSTVSGGTAIDKDGATKSAAEIIADNFFETLFSNDTAWTYETGKLPILAGLSGQDATMPAHIIDIPAGQFFNGEGTSEKPYEIATPAQFAKLAELVNDSDTNEEYGKQGVHYKLMNNLDLSGYASGTGWVPIGQVIDSEYNTFQGSFDGGGHVITGLTISRPGSDYQGLFGYAQTATISNLGIVGADITGGSYVGGVVGSINYGSVNHCYITGSVSGTDRVGGVIGTRAGGDGRGGLDTIRGCYSAATVSGNQRVGGVAGNLIGTVENCYATGTVSGESNIGGVVGDLSSSGTVKNCYATGAVSGKSYVGGVAGFVYGSVENCYATGAVSGESYIGGMAGNLSSSGTVTNCAALNPTVSGTSDVGRVAGRNAGTLQNSIAFSGMAVTVNDSAKALDEGADKVDGEDKSAADIQGWTSDFWTNSDNWNAADGAAAWSADNWQFTTGGLPILKDTDGNVLPGQSAALPTHLAAEGAIPFEGAGTSGDPYLIKTAADLAKLAELVNGGNDFSGKHLRLMNNLDLSGYATADGGAGWTPIGTEANQFNGSFDGSGHVITGLTINRPASDYQGLFGYAYMARISNLGIVGANITGAYCIGGVVGWIVYGSVNRCYVTGSVSGTGDYVGGVIGMRAGGDVAAGDIHRTIHDCYSAAMVSGSNRVGGMVGSLVGTVENCYATGTVSGKERVGGVAGYVGTSGTVQSCTALNPSVSGTSDVGRVAGYVYGSGKVQNNYAYAGMECTSKGDSYSNGTELTSATLFGDSFWTTAGNWDTSAWSADNWEFADGKLPTLKGIAGQSGAPNLYLLKFSTNELTVTLSGTDVSGNGASYTALASYNLPQHVTVTVTGMADWTDPLVTITAKKAANDETITISPIENGKGAFLIPAKFSGNITVTAASVNNPNNKTSVTLTVNKRTLTAGDFSAITIPNDHVYTGSAQGIGTVDLPTGMQHMTVQYNGNPTVPTGAGTYIVTLHYAGDDVYNATEEYGFAIGNYTIAPKPLTISGVTAVTREYDGTDTVALSGGGALFGVESVDTGKLGRDMGIGTMEDANAGDGKAVTTNIILTGTAQSNYTLTQPDGITVDIAKKALTITSSTVENKEYDGTDTATVNGVTFTGLVGSETLTLGTDYTAAGTFSNANVGNGKSVTVTPALNSTEKSNNYSISGTVNTTADITHKVITGTASIDVTQGDSGDANRIDAGDTLTANTSSIIGTVAGNATLSYQWYRDDTPIGGATESTYTVAARATDPAGSLITVKVTGTGNYSGDKTSEAVEIGRIPLGGSVSIDGTPNLSHTLTLNTALLTPSGATTSVQWLRDGTAISGAIGNNYAITKADLGKSISVSVTGTGEYSGTKTAEISISAVVPETPTNFSAAAGNGQVTLSWTVPFDGGSALTKYQLSKDDGANWQDIGLVTTYTVTGLTNGTEYTFKLRAVNSVGEGAEASVTATPVRPSGGSGGGSYTPPAPPATPAPQWLEQSGTSQAISDAKEQGTSQILTRASGQYGVRQATWAAFVGHQFWHDTMDGNAVQVRTYIKNPIALTTDLLVSGYVKGVEVEQTKALFERFFANKVRTIHMDQTGVWGQTIELAAKVDLTGMDITKLYIYSYDKATNTYRRIEKPAYWVDTNGYLHFYTTLAGDIIISEGPLARIENGAK